MKVQDDLDLTPPTPTVEQDAIRKPAQLTISVVRDRLRRIDPPYYFFLSIIGMTVLHVVAPVVRVISFPWAILGLFPIAAGITLNAMADHLFKRSGTSVKPTGPQTALMTSGVFRYSRNPMYLGFVLILLGGGVLAGSLTPFVVVACFFLFMDTVFVSYEEEKLEKTYSTAWLDYRATVRKWL